MAHVTTIKQEFDPLTSYVRMLERVAQQITNWELKNPTENARGHLGSAALHIRLAAKHMLRAEGRPVPGEDS
jgi:hypothetical protein